MTRYTYLPTYNGINFPIDVVLYSAGAYRQGILIGKFTQTIEDKPDDNPFLLFHPEDSTNIEIHSEYENFYIKPESTEFIVEDHRKEKGLNWDSYDKEIAEEQDLMYYAENS